MSDCILCAWMYAYPPGTRSGRPLLTQLAPYPVQSPHTVHTIHWSSFHLCMPGWHITDFSSFSSSSSSRSSSIAVAMFSMPNTEKHVDMLLITNIPLVNYKPTVKAATQVYVGSQLKAFGATVGLFKVRMAAWRQSSQHFTFTTCRTHFLPLPAWVMDPVSLPHWPLLFTPNVHTSPLLVRTQVCALPIATWVTKWPFRSLTWPKQEMRAFCEDDAWFCTVWGKAQQLSKHK